MAQLRPAPRPSVIKQFSNFTNSTVGLEKTLRLIQALAQLAAEVSTDNVLAKRCLIAKSHLALSRRYFRFFTFIPCFERVFALLGGNFSSGFLLSMIALAKFSSLAIYLVLEDSTILHAMNVWPVPWNTPVLVEANKFWFYALCLSIVGAVVEILGSLLSTGVQKKGKNGGAKGGRAQPTAPLVKRIVVDGCDLLLPGTFLGWIEAGDFTVGVAMVLSTVVASGDVWARAQ